MSDVRDILELDIPEAPELNKHTIMGIKQSGHGLKKKKEKDVMKRPKEMHRELYALLYSSDGYKDLPPLLPTDSDKGYKSNKAKLGMKKVRPWKWMAFTNPARTDGAILYHWRKACDEGKDYPFALFNKKTELLKYTEAEYNKHFNNNNNWTKVETDSLFDLGHQFDLRWTVMHDRWPSELSKKSIEDMKERYYEITNCLKKVRSLTGAEGKIVHYDAEHEKKRKEQLRKLFERTPEQYEEEQRLLGELRKIEARKKEREKKTADLQKLISATDTSADSKKVKTIKKKTISKTKGVEPAANLNIENCTGIKFPDVKTLGVSLRSQKMKLPGSVGQKKTKAIEQMLTSIGLELNPIPTEETSKLFNDLRSDLVLMYELKNLIANYVYEMQSMKHQYESLNPTKSLEIPENLLYTPDESPIKQKGISEVIDYIIASPSTPNRKRKAALEQSNILKKIKQRT